MEFPILKNKTFIQQKRPIVVSNRLKFGQKAEGFYVQQPIAGFVDKEWWEKMKVFQSTRDLRQTEFVNTIVEFNILVGVSVIGEEEYKRTHCQLGVRKWEEVI